MKGVWLGLLIGFWLFLIVGEILYHITIKRMGDDG